MTGAAASALGGFNIGALLLTVLVFLAIGPFVGGLVMIVGLGLTIGVETGEYGGIFAMIATMIIYGLWTSWFMGALPALAVGVLIAIVDAFRCGSWMVALTIGLGAGAALAVASGGLQNFSVGACFVVASLAATLVCYAATRGFARR